MKLSEAFPSAFLKAEDLNNRQVSVTIEAAEIEVIGQGRDRENKLVLTFRGKEKKLICNKTNANSIAAVYGDDTDAWIGQRITLVSMQVEYQGKMGPAIRVLGPATPAIQRPAAAPAARPAPRPAPAPAAEQPPFDEGQPPADDNSDVPF
jgi:hypothetical protein